ncbi:acyl carrier protein [Plebeiibacterium sediminum]|uniref:Acyl carrier protein n=1 Tax=Plebeiibacterium sediminum TaxID=2992112 RepID=A0AAE3M2G7_9BACT|nr:phosphopantetheine-binding protein [Plebeiobacterium sediminum]MCW3785544.1 phosphopantetheine-binding protein [Plebeiobacterium sediminum]
MERGKIKDIVVAFLIDEFEIDEDVISDEAHLIDDLGLESLDFVDIVVIIEKEFGFKVKREEMKEIRVLNDLYTYIENNLK